MRLKNVLFSSWVAVSLVLGSGNAEVGEVQRRQENTASAAGSAFPTLGSQNTQPAPSTAASGTTNPSTRPTQSASNTESISVSGSGSIIASATRNSNGTSTLPPTSTPSSLLPTSTPVSSGNTTAGVDDNVADDLPLQPHITPALSIGGVILILTGIVYTIIGVKNRWIHIFLSTAYLTSLAITVLIVYVLNPPISNAVQGAYFVAIFMTGVIFGGGALIFKEVTEGLGCLLGGFCLSMWFLTLKEGGLITSTGGKAIFISAFCVISWSLSFSHYTRAYGLMGSISFSGATAFVLGIDCFSRGGLKEFWLYIWDLNDNLFALNTHNYPITRGTRVESIVIILGCIIGIISQLKLWKIVKDRQKQKNEVIEEEGRRREAVEAALGRHLERQNDRDRSQWERQYGDRLNAKRETVLWTEAHAEKGFTKPREAEISGSQNSSSSESLEMSNMSRKPRSMYVTRIKRTSMPVTAIPEVEEGEAPDKDRIRQKVLEQLEGSASNSEFETGPSTGNTPSSSPRPEKTKSGISTSASTIDLSHERHSAASDSLSIEDGTQQGINEKRISNPQVYLSAPQDEKKKKRRSFVSFLSRSPKTEDDSHNLSQSQEALVIPESTLRHSRASSLAATLDYENEKLELPTVDVEIPDVRNAPEIIVSPVGLSSSNNAQYQPTIRHIPSEPELLEDNIDADPEEFVRPAAGQSKTTEEDQRISLGPSATPKRQSGSEVGTEILFEDGYRPKVAPSESSQAEVLTKDALDSMPSQLSHVVMSYRTNEWAKHIATADAPLVEEPEPVEEAGEAEAVTHLADPTSPTGSKRSSLNIAVPPQVPAPVPSALPSIAEGIRVNPAIQPDQPIVSAVVTPAPPPIPVSNVAQATRIRSTSESSNIPRGFRSTSTPMLAKQVLQNTAIDENQAMSFNRQQQNLRSASAMSLHQQYMQANTPSISRAQTTLSNYGGGVQRSSSRLSMVSEGGIIPARSISQLSNYQPSVGYQHSPYMQSPNQQQGSFQPIPSRSDTRLQFYDSHQPTRRNDFAETQKREAMFADWRNTQQRMPTQQDHAEQHRQQMLMERQQIKMVEEQEKNYRWQQELNADARMRGRDMQELHREAMRKMQAGVNRKMTN